jgi:ATPase subunit of ABC transporter with duplicated ATPase domains
MSVRMFPSIHMGHATINPLALDATLCLFEGMGIQRSEVERVLESVGFGDAMRSAAIASLSGGWKMKLALGEGCSKG